MKSPVFVLKPKPLSSPPPLTPVTSYKAKPPLVDSNTPSLTPFARVTTLNSNMKKTWEMKPSTEFKVSSLNTGWKNNNPDANHFRMIQPCERMQLSEHLELQVPEKDQGNGKAMMATKHTEGNKLPPMSVLAGTSGKGGAMTRYTDR